MAGLPDTKEGVAVRAIVMHILEAVNTESAGSTAWENAQADAANDAGGPGGCTINHFNPGESVVATVVALHDHGHVWFGVDDSSRDNSHLRLLLDYDRCSRSIIVDGDTLRRLGRHVASLLGDRRIGGVRSLRHVRSLGSLRGIAHWSVRIVLARLLHHGWLLHHRLLLHHWLLLLHWLDRVSGGLLGKRLIVVRILIWVHFISK